MARGRKASPGSLGRRPNAYKRDCETFGKKLDVINFYSQHGMQATLAKYYSHLADTSLESKRKRILEWKNNRTMIESMASTTTGAQLKSARKKGSGTTILRIGEEALVEWVNSLREEGIPVSRLMLQLRAKSVAEDEGVAEGVFEGSWVWQQSFLGRHGLTLRAKTRQGQQAPSAMEQEAAEFWATVEQTRLNLNVSKIYNADQSGVCFEYLPKQTISKKGAKTVWVRCGGKDKDRFTGMFLADSDGKQYPPFFVMKTKASANPDTAAYNTAVQHGFGKTLWKEVQSLTASLGVQIYGNSAAWWNSDLSVAWLDFHFASRADDEPVLLLWDDFSGHWTEEVEAYANTLNVFLLKVPPGLTSVCQPADISWFRPFKQRLRKEWVNHLSTQLRMFSSSSADAAFKMIAPTRATAITWATTAWRELGAGVVRSGFKGLLKARSCGSSTHSTATESEEQRNSISTSADITMDTTSAVVARLETLNVIIDTVDDSDDIVENSIGEAGDA